MKTAQQRLRALARDQRGQALTEYVILTALMTAAAAYLYLPDNTIYRGTRLKHDRTQMVIAYPGP